MADLKTTGKVTGCFFRGDFYLENRLVYFLSKVTGLKLVFEQITKTRD